MPRGADALPHRAVVRPLRVHDRADALVERLRVGRGLRPPRARARRARAPRGDAARLHRGAGLPRAARRDRCALRAGHRPRTWSRSPRRRRGSSRSSTPSSARATTPSSRRRATSRRSRSRARRAPTVDEWRRTYADGWAHDLDALDGSSSAPETKLVYVNTPHNPTGLQMPARCSTPSSSSAPSAVRCSSATRSTASSSTTRPTACRLRATSTSARCRSGASRRPTACPGLRTGWIACRDDALRDAIVAVKLYTTICSSAPSELLAALALRNREQLVERNRRLVLENLELADRFVEEHADLVDWARPNASPIGFPRLRVPDTQAFCERLAAEAGVLLLPGEVYDEPGHVRLGLGRPRHRRGVRAALGLRRASSPDGRLEVLLDEAEQHAVDPLAVPPVRLAADALAHPPRPLGVAQRALVEAVDLHLDPVEAELAKQVALERPRRVDADAPPAEAGAIASPPTEAIRERAVHALPRHGSGRARRPPRRRARRTPPARAPSARSPRAILLRRRRAHRGEERRDVLVRDEPDEERDVVRGRAAERDAHRAAPRPPCARGDGGARPSRARRRRGSAPARRAPRR